MQSFDIINTTKYTQSKADVNILFYEARIGYIFVLALQIVSLINRNQIQLPSKSFFLQLPTLQAGA